MVLTLFKGTPRMASPRVSLGSSRRRDLWESAWSFWESEVDLERERMENQPWVLKQIESGAV